MTPCVSIADWPCADCGGAVDVVCMNGAALRCGCGHTTVTAPPRPPVEQYGDHNELRALLKVLIAHKVTAYKAKDCEIALSPDAWKVDAPPQPTVPEKVCECGCALHAHGEAGCLNGCPLEKCGLAEEAA